MKKRMNMPLLALVMINVYWGVTTVLMKNVLVYMSSYAYLMLRFGLAALFLGMIYTKKIKNCTRETWKRGIILGLFIIVPMEFTVIGLQYTSTSNSIFISQLSFIVVPAIVYLKSKTRPPYYFYITVLSLVIGLAIFSNIIENGMNLGDLLTFVGMLFTSINTLIIDHYSKDENPIQLGVIQMIVAAVFSSLLGISDVPSIHWNLEVLWILFLTGIVGSGVAFTLRIYSQKKIDPIIVSILSIISPIFGVIGAAMIAGASGNVEAITVMKVIGGTIILLSLVYFMLMNKRQQTRSMEVK